MSFISLFKNKYKKPAYSLYQRLVEQARSPWFYEILKIEDSVKGRFELIALHSFLLLHRLKNNRDLAQALFDAMFADLDRSIRELGVGDLSVGKKIKSFAELFYGRIECYEKGLQNAAYLQEIFVLFFQDAAKDPLKLKDLSLYTIGQARYLADVDDALLMVLDPLFKETKDDTSS